MSRDDGFEIADTDTGMVNDPKFVALARRLRDSIQTMAAVGLYDAVRLASWRAGCRLTLDETLPGWWLELDVDAFADHLIAVGLLDAERRVPVHAWEGWFGPAYNRREDARLKGAIGGLMGSLGMTKEQAITEARRRRSTVAQAQLESCLTRPSVSSVIQTVRPSRDDSNVEKDARTPERRRMAIDGYLAGDWTMERARPYLDDGDEAALIEGRDPDVTIAHESPAGGQS